MTQHLSAEAEHIIDSYTQLSIGGKKIRCPYYNNKKIKARAALRVLVGKGSAQEIEEEAFLLALKEKVSLSEYSEEQITQFLVDHHLGIDCSAFAFYILNAESNGKLQRHIRSVSTNILRRLLFRWRLVENINVKTLADDKNSLPIPLEQIAPGDIITIIGTAETQRDHVLIVRKVQKQKDKTISIEYVHSLQWKKDGLYNHGIRTGSMHISDREAALAEQGWEEDGYTNKEENETLQRIVNATRVELRRLNMK